MLQVTYEDKNARVLINRLKERKQHTRPLMDDIAERMVRSVKRNFDEGGRPDKWKKSGSESTLVKSRRLRNSIHGSATRTEARVGTNVKYARIHHHGGVIRPKNAKNLAIPLQDWIKAGPRNYYLHYVPASKKDNRPAMLVRYQSGTVGRGKKAQMQEEMVPMFLLVKKVKIPARPYMLIQNEDKTYIADRVKEFLTHGRLS